MSDGVKSAIYKGIIIAGVLAVSLALRLYSLDSDPPDYLSWSAAIYVDEGYKALDARNTVKYGSNHWTPYDEYRGHRYTSRIIHEVQLWIFDNFGVKIRSLRHFNIAVSVAIIAVVLATMAFIFDTRMVLMLGISFAINVVFLFQSRLALYEFPMLLMGVILYPALFLFFNHGIIRTRAARAVYLLFLVVLILAVTSFGLRIKGNFFVYMCSIAGAFFFSALLPVYKKRERVHRFLEPHRLFFLLVCMVLAAGFILYAFQEKIGIQSRYLRNPLMLLGKMWFMEVIYLQPDSFIMSVLCSIAVLKILSTVRYAHLSRRRLLEYQVDLFFTVQYILSFLMVYMSSYSPLRYFLFCQVPILYLASRFVSNYDAEIRILRSVPKTGRSTARRVLIFFLVFYAVEQFIIFLVMLFLNYETRKMIFDDFYKNLAGGNVRNVHAYYVITMVAIALPLIYYLAKNYDDITTFFKRHLSRKIMVFLLVEVQLIYLLSWQFNKTSKLRECMDFVDTLPANSVIIGDWAPMLAFESDLKIIYSNPAERRNVRNIPKFRPDYVVVKSNRGEEDEYNRYDPGLIKPENAVYSFSVQAFDITIYRVDKYRKLRQTVGP